ncbi:MAG: ORF6N domain-containing protein [Candidatus Omnitrophica bacterium]|nr:ORF6N domain-containing protein [Candidatus Omnitrophota bacterium]MDD5670493.1 ORF6N domain-containing protein [Candidatus Omnitrophota bacterium]
MSNISITPIEKIEQAIFFIRGKKVMLDRDLAALYGVPTKVLNQAVKRNRTRFPIDFMFQLTKKEMTNWKSQIVTSNTEKMGIRKQPYAFTENGVAMLSSVLHSGRAIAVNIQIMRTFTRLREMIRSHKKLWDKIKAMEKNYDRQFQLVFHALREFMEESSSGTPHRQIGFHP